MSEKVSLTDWLEVADVRPSELLMEAPLPSGPEKTDLPTTPEIPLPMEELLNTLIVDTRYAPQPPSPGEAQAPDLLALSPASSLLTDDLSPSPSSPLSTSIGSPTAPASPFEDLQEQVTLTNLADVTLSTIDASEVLQNFSPSSPANSSGDISAAPESSLSSPSSSSGDIPLTLEGSSIQVIVVEPPKKELPQPKSKARPKVKSVSDPVQKKSKKRDQNKRAATRYRQKKRGEMGQLEEERDSLEQTNKELHDKVDSISREIKYLKDLLAEVYKVKGEIKVLRKK